MKSKYNDMHTQGRRFFLSVLICSVIIFWWFELPVSKLIVSTIVPVAVSLCVAVLTVPIRHVASVTWEVAWSCSRIVVLAMTATGIIVFFYLSHPAYPLKLDISDGLAVMMYFVGLFDLLGIHYTIWKLITNTKQENTTKKHNI